MTRFNLYIAIYDEKVTVGDDGTPRYEKVNEAHCFANRYTVGTTAWLAGKDSGLHPEAMLNVRTCDYSHQTRVELDGTEYMVEESSCSGEFTRLVLRRRLANE